VEKMVRCLNPVSQQDLDDSFLIFKFKIPGFKGSKDKLPAFSAVMKTCSTSARPAKRLGREYENVEAVTKKIPFFKNFWLNIALESGRRNPQSLPRLTGFPSFNQPISI
jgi:hypothetical protein